ncbi:hypothetical protein [Rhizobium hidalgonense]|uniref:hypothetical protein n=1 Tax=Rhizobium hidalgonense TaxID=1538159 RepID=UPI001105AA8C|nr:hypothetical protein [Rhizobium hidalgonense]QKK24648.1 hypothetical protein FFM81_015435 [Rhizobium hidalgonense]
MPYAVGLDQIGTNTPVYDGNGESITGDYIEISWDDYQAAINLLVSGKHVFVMDGQFVLGYEIPPQEP